MNISVLAAALLVFGLIPEVVGISGSTSQQIYSSGNSAGVLAPSSPVSTKSSGANEQALESIRTSKALMFHGIRVVVMNPSHALLDRDYQRLGNAVMVTVARDQLPLSNNTHCVCRLITHVKCSCVYLKIDEDPKKEEAKKESRNECCRREKPSQEKSFKSFAPSAAKA
jgi:hypothetical protein